MTASQALNSVISLIGKKSKKPKAKMAERSKKAFMLIELLVVIAIIARLLLALAKVKEMARQILCMSNVTSLTGAAMVCTSSNDDRLPILVQVRVLPISYQASNFPLT